MKKKLTAVALIVCMLAIMLVGASLAYFTDEDEATNTFTVGNVQIDLVEPSWDAEGIEDAPQVYPGEALAKDPIVKNTGANPCFVRIKVEGLNCLGENLLITYETENVSGALGENWVKGADGYYYFTKVLTSVDDKDSEWNVGLPTETTALFDHIRIPTNLTNEDGAEFADKYDVDITAEAIQAQGAMASWSQVKAMDAAAIEAWFDTVIDNAQ